MRTAKAIFVLRLMIVLLSVSCAWPATRTVNVGQGGTNFVDQVSNTSTTTINEGDTVHWVWQSSPHSTTSGTCSPGCAPDGTWDSTILTSPNTFDFTFNSAGTFPYYCRVHLAGMLGKVIVQPVVSNTNDSGPGSLRQAILDVNADPDLTQITFAIPGGGVHTITPLSALPVITGPVVLDATSQPGWAPGVLVIQLNGASAGPGADGLSIQGGGTTVKGLVINGFAQNGIVLPSNGNTIAGNFIGTNAAGTAAVANAGDGVVISGGASNNTVGSVSGSGNVISGNAGNGISISGGDSNMIQGNFIGIDVSGNAALGNGSNGILINGATNTYIAIFPGGRNIISGNIGDGVNIVTANTNFVSGNFVGTNAAGTAAVGNHGNGMTINASGNFIGGPVQGANVISGNGNHGILVSGSNVVEGNFIGTNASGSAALGNAGYGVAVVNGGCPIGGTLPGAGNVISGNALGGLLISGTAAGSTVYGNLIGTDATGTSAVGNGGNGISIAGGAVSCRVGGAIAGAPNVISGNVGSGVVITGVGTSFNQVQGNFIGTDITGNNGVPNMANGVLIQSQADSSTIGGAAAGAGNVISGNGGSGVVLSDLGTTKNQVDGNFIGINATGVAALGNGQYGLLMVNGPSGNHVGLSARNIISGNAGAGVVITDVITGGNTVAGNYIGTNAAGSSAVGNGSGVLLLNGTSANQIGLGLSLTNVISGNSGNGVLLSGSGTKGNYVTGNNIGTDASGTAAIANLGDGVRIDNGAFGNFIGIEGFGNTIAFNAKGVVVASDTAIDNAIADNSIFSNTGLGIDLNDDGVTPNTVVPPGSQHTGPNHLQNYPVFVPVFSGGFLNVNGILNGVTNTIFRLEFFSNPACDPSGHGQGQTFLGSQNVTTDGTGNTTFTASVPDSNTSAPAISATATDQAGNTSEFSACQLADYALTNVAGRNLRVRLGQPFNLVVATFTDTDPSGDASQFTGSTIDWGDGTAPSAATIVSVVGQNYKVMGTHTYTKVRGWTVTVYINDSGGALATATSKARLWPKAFSF
jgi:titin